MNNNNLHTRINQFDYQIVSILIADESIRNNRQPTPTKRLIAHREGFAAYVLIDYEEKSMRKRRNGANYFEQTGESLSFFWRSISATSRLRVKLSAMRSRTMTASTKTPCRSGSVIVPTMSAAIRN